MKKIIEIAKNEGMSSVAIEKLQAQLEMISALNKKETEIENYKSKLNSLDPFEEQALYEEYSKQMENFKDSFTEEEMMFMDEHSSNDIYVDYVENTLVLQCKDSYKPELVCGNWLLFNVNSDDGNEPSTGDFIYFAPAGEPRLIKEVSFEKLSGKEFQGFLNENSIRVPSKAMKNLSYYLQKIVREFHRYPNWINTTRRHSFVGFKKNDRTKFGLYHLIGSDSDSTIIGNYLPYVKPRGNIKVYLDLLRNNIIEVQLQFAFMLGFTSPIVTILNNLTGVDNIIFNIFGKSSTGKSIATELALSAFCNPIKSDNPFYRDFFGTHKANIRRMTDTQGLLDVIDDTSTIYMKTKEMQSTIYALDAGVTDTVCDGHGGTTKAHKKSGVTLMSSERRICSESYQAGASVRLCEIGINCWTPTAEIAQVIRSTIKLNYGLIGEDFMTYLLSSYNEDSLHELYARVVIKLLDLIKEDKRDDLTERQVERLAFVLVSSEIFNSYSKYMKYDYFVNLDALYKFAVQIITDAFDARDNSNGVYNAFIEAINARLNRFKGFTTQPRPGDEIIDGTWGYIEKCDQDLIIYITTEGRKSIEKIANNGNCILDTTYSKWADKGLLLYEEDNLGRRIYYYSGKLYGKSTRFWRFVIKGEKSDTNK